MAAVAPSVLAQQPRAPISSINSILNEGLTSIPSSYVLNREGEDAFKGVEPDSLPIIDYSLLVSNDPEERSKAVHDLGKACEEWGFFMVVNHGIPESQMKAIADACHSFFLLPEDEKVAYKPKHALSPIKIGTSYNKCAENEFCWRDFINLHVHPTFNCPDKPAGFREVLSEYCKATRKIALKLLGGISESLGLEEGHIEKASKQEEGFQMFVSNYYPKCPQPELAMGISSHTDDGFINLLIQNGVDGLQILHNDKWFNVHAAPIALIVNIADHIEIITNGKYKSVYHRATVNHNVTRISVAVSISPPLDMEVEPLPELVDEEHPAAYRPMRYGDYVKEVHSEYLLGNVIDRIKIHNVQGGKQMGK